MKKQYLFVFVSLICLSINFISCQANDEESGRLRSVVFYYKFIRFSPQKAEAARFLMENMKYHASTGQVVSVPSEVEAWQAESNALYNSIIAGHSLSDFPKDSLEKMQK